MRIFGYQSENTTVGGYRIWSPLNWLKKLGMAETKYLKPQKEMYCPLDPPTAQHPDPKYNKEMGSIREHYEWADFIVRQKSFNLHWDSLLQLLKDKFNYPLIVDSDDNMISVNKSNPVAHLYENKTNPMEEVIETKNSEEARKLETKGYIVALFGDTYRCGRFKPEYITYFTLKMIRMANALTVTNKHLKTAYESYNKNIYILPNYIDTDRWEGIVNNTERESDKQVVVGWYGGQSHLDDMVLIREVIPALFDKYPNVIFKWSGLIPEFWRQSLSEYQDRFQYIAWTQDTLGWERNFASFGFDIALAPLIDNRFNRCKSNIKWMEAAMLDLPMVASKVEAYSCIHPGKDGFLVTKYLEWMKYVGRLIESKSLCQEIGGAAKERVLREYNLKDHVWKWKDVYEKVRQNHELKKRNIVLVER